MIDYLDRKLRQLAYADWVRLYRDPAYGTLKDVTVGGFRIEAAWVGPVGNWENPPRPFLLLIQQTDKFVKLPKGLQAESWHESEAAVLTAFAGAVKAVQ